MPTRLSRPSKQMATAVNNITSELTNAPTEEDRATGVKTKRNQRARVKANPIGRGAFASKEQASVTDDDVKELLEYKLTPIWDQDSCKK